MAPKPKTWHEIFQDIDTWLDTKVDNFFDNMMLELSKVDIPAYLRSAKTFLQENGKKFISAVNNFIDEKVKPLFAELKEMKESIKGFMGWLTKSIHDMSKRIHDYFSQPSSGSTLQAVKGFFKGLGDYLKEGVHKAWGKVIGKFQELRENMEIKVQPQ